MKTVFELLNHDNTISVNRRLAHALGLAESVIYAALLAKHEWYAKQDRLEDGWFYSTVEDMEESTALSGKVQRRCIKKLEEAGLIMCRTVGIPMRRYFFIADSVGVLEKLCGEICAEPGKTESEHTQAPDGDLQNFPKGMTSCAEREHSELPDGNIQNCPKGTTSCDERSQKTKVNKTKENKPELVDLDSARERINFGKLSGEYGEGFAELAAEVAAEGRAGLFTITTDGRTVDSKTVSSVFEKVGYEAVCHVADYISKKGGVRNLKAYLRTALYKAVGELAQKPSVRKRDYSEPLWDEPSRSSIDYGDVMEELRRQYSEPAPEKKRDYDEPLWD